MLLSKKETWYKLNVATGEISKVHPFKSTDTCLYFGTPTFGTTRAKKVTKDFLYFESHGKAVCHLESITVTV